MAIDKEKLDVLVVEDDEDDFFIARTLLGKARSIHCNLEWAQSFEEGLERVTERDYDVALVDYRLGARNGLDLLQEAGRRGAGTPMILLTGQGDLEIDIRAMMAGAADYLVKGQIDAQLLERSIRYARERKRAEERIREQAALLDKARDAISAYDLDGHAIYWNKSAERLTGYAADDVLGRATDELLYAAQGDTVRDAWAAVRSKGEWTGELRLHAREGEEATVESRWTLVRDGAGNPRSVLVINTDITERKQLEAQFLRSQRMESIGRLVGGIAHDLGNLLVPILLGVKVMQQRFADDEKTGRTLAMIQKSAQRGSDMVKQVLAFARGVEGERVPLHLDAVIQEVERIAQETFPSTIDVSARVGDGLWVVKGDATQLQQVLMNLCVNARDAMPDGGMLTVEAANLDVDESFTKVNIDANEGPHVQISVIDTGEGIPPDVLDKVFEPFFTTKVSGKGTGLGLSTVYSIVKSHGGFLVVDSEVGEGTSFCVFLPATTEQVASRVDDEIDLPRGNGETVLVVDDEEYILETTKDTLEGLGYRVLTARDGHEAIQTFEQHRDDVDLVLTDLMMPNLDGVSAIRELKARYPELRVLAWSGMAGGKAQEALDAGAALCLSKPFTTERLCSALADLLRDKASAQ